MKVSVCIATYKRPRLLERTLQSIYKQNLSFEWEVIVIEDWGENYRNPAAARNAAYKKAKGEVIIAQSDDVMHVGNCIESLVRELTLGHFVTATVYNVDEQGRKIRDNYGLDCYTGPKNKRPLFFLGALWRSDLYAVGGNDEEFIYPGREDVWFGLCLMRGLGLNPIYSEDIIGHHQHHPRNLDRSELQHSAVLFKTKFDLATVGLHPWGAKAGSWPLSTST
jgi:glycosyltransferase involved in cell wall biosynthesis